MGQGIPSTGLPMIQNWEEGLRHQRVMLPLRDLDRLEKQANKGMCKVLHLWKNKITHTHQGMLGAN